METETIKKNGASLKSRMSRVNVILTKVFWIFGFMCIIMACDDNKDNSNAIVADPDGTVITNIDDLSLGGSRVLYYSQGGCIFYTDGGAVIATVGTVNGLGNITTKPNSGWVTSTAPEVGYGYVIKLADGTFCRLYVMEEIPFASGYGIYAIRVKYQYPF